MISYITSANAFYDSLCPVIMKLESTDIDANLEYTPIDR